MLKLNNQYMNENPESVLISNRIADLINYYGGTQVLGSLIRAKRPLILIKNGSDIHILNLINTYGLDQVVSVYELIWGKAINQEIA